MRKAAVFIAAIAGALCALPAMADTMTAAPSSTIVDLSGVVSSIEGIVFGAAAAALAWLGHRAVIALEGSTASAAAATAEQALSKTIAWALGLARTRLDESLQGKTTVDVHSTLAAQAAELVANAVPGILDTLGLCQADIEAKILGLLGLSLPPVQTVATPAPADTSTEETVRKVLAAIKVASTPAPVAAPVAAPAA